LNAETILTWARGEIDQSINACRTSTGINKRIAGNVLPALLDKSQITQFGQAFFTNPDRFSLAQSSYSPEDFGSRKGAGRALFSARASAEKAFAAAISEFRSFRAKFNQGGVIDADGLSCAVEAASETGADAIPETEPVCLAAPFGPRQSRVGAKARAQNDGAVGGSEEDVLSGPGSLLNTHALYDFLSGDYTGMSGRVDSWHAYINSDRYSCMPLLCKVQVLQQMVDSLKIIGLTRKSMAQCLLTASVHRTSGFAALPAFRRRHCALHLLPLQQPKH
jgi:hypothetical protein